MFSESNNISSGCIEVICGSMFSGKTEELIRRLRRAQYARLKIAIYKPCIDNRYSEVEVVSHDGSKITSQPISDAAQMLDAPADIQVIGVDEAQFFGDNLVEVCQKLADRGVRVICAGLDTDFLGNPFGPIPQLMAVAEEVRKVHAICVRCGALANHSHRLVKSKDLVLIGETDSYEPLCRSCYNKAVAEDNS